MRPPTAGEILLLARTLMTKPAKGRRHYADSLLRDVGKAAHHQAATGRAHPAFGDGSLAARCHLADPRPEPMADDPDFLAALVVAAQSLRRYSRL
jgi:hypothetical protein